MMEKLFAACRALYDTVFPDASQAWNDALFRHVMPDCLRVIAEGEKPLSMLFSIPYPIKTASGSKDARYLYGVATDPAYRGRGLARELIAKVLGEGYPVFLRPSSASLFDFYRRLGFTPISPTHTAQGRADASLADIARMRHLTPREYLAAREKFLQPPFAAPTAAFLSLGVSLGGAVGQGREFAAFYERRGKEVWFKEWLGNRLFAPRAAAFLGAETYRLRTPDAGGTPFGMAFNSPAALSFLIALD